MTTTPHHSRSHRVGRRRATSMFHPLIIATAVLFVAWSMSAVVMAGPRIIVAGPTLEASPAYLRIEARLIDDTDKPLHGDAAKISDIPGLQDFADIDEMLNPGGESTSFSAFLDTGASANVLSRSTADRFGVQRVQGGVYHETGLHGQTAMDVSLPYRLHIGEATGAMAAISAPRFTPIVGDMRFQISRTSPKNPLVTMAFGEINVIGMPAIRQIVVEVNPSPMVDGVGELDMEALEKDLGIEGLDLGALGDMAKLGGSPSVSYHRAGYEPADFDIVIPLKYVDFARWENENDKGPLPSMTDNPVIERIRTQHKGGAFTGDWLLDTGAPASLISTAHAQRLGLVDEEGEPVRAPDFTLPLGGVSGNVKPANGFVVDLLHIPLQGGDFLEFHHVRVLVVDVGTTLDSGQHVTLDGVFGTNMLLPTVGGISFGLPSSWQPGSFSRWWIDGPNGRLLLKLRPASERFVQTPEATAAGVMP